MFDKKKIHFWRLSFIFLGLTIVTLIILWSTPQYSKSSMMDGSMGNMMKQMHVSGKTIYDLFGTEKGQNQMRENMKEMHSHHQGQSPVIYKLNFLSTAVIFFLLPFIIGGAVILTIVWIK
ncbi:MAG: hypothetical protein N2645_06675 [Clostridia bacterium]|nr:hypothetical protein [Clostridia bacterium]